MNTIALAVQTLLLLVITITIIAWARKELLTRGIDILIKLDQRFDSADFREHRRRAAAFLGDFEHSKSGHGLEALHSVLGLFETIAFFHEKNLIDAESAWTFFGHWALPYYLISKQRVIDIDKHHYQKLKSLVKKFESLDLNDVGSEQFRFMNSDKYKSDFLLSEQGISTISRKII